MHWMASQHTFRGCCYFLVALSPCSKQRRYHHSPCICTTFAGAHTGFGPREPPWQQQNGPPELWPGQLCWMCCQHTTLSCDTFPQTPFPLHVHQTLLSCSQLQPPHNPCGPSLSAVATAAALSGVALGAGACASCSSPATRLRCRADVSLLPSAGMRACPSQPVFFSAIGIESVLEIEELSRCSPSFRVSRNDREQSTLQTITQVSLPEAHTFRGPSRRLHTRWACSKFLPPYKLGHCCSRSFLEPLSQSVAPCRFVRHLEVSSSEADIFRVPPPKLHSYQVCLKLLPPGASQLGCCCSLLFLEPHPQSIAPHCFLRDS